MPLLSSLARVGRAAARTTNPLLTRALHKLKPHAGALGPEDDKSHVIFRNQSTAYIKPGTKLEELIVENGSLMAFAITVKERLIHNGRTAYVSGSRIGEASFTSWHTQIFGLNKKGNDTGVLSKIVKVILGRTEAPDTPHGVQQPTLEIANSTIDKLCLALASEDPVNVRQIDVSLKHSNIGEMVCHTPMVVPDPEGKGPIEAHLTIDKDTRDYLRAITFQPDRRPPVTVPLGPDDRTLVVRQCEVEHIGVDGEQNNVTCLMSIPVSHDPQDDQDSANTPPRRGL